MQARQYCCLWLAVCIFCSCVHCCSTAHLSLSSLRCNLWSAAYEFLLRSCTVSERAPHFVLVTVPAPAAGAAESGQLPAAWGEHLRVQLQNILDGLRRSDIAAARERQDQQASAAGASGWGRSAAELRQETRRHHPQSCITHPTIAPLLALFLQRASTEEAMEGPPLTFGAGGGPAGTAAASQAAAQQQQMVEVAQPAGSAPAAATAAAAAAGAALQRFPDLSTMGPLQLTFVSIKPGSTSGSDSAAELDGGQPSGSGGSVCVLFEVTPLHSTPANSEGWCSVPGWPLRCGKRGHKRGQLAGQVCVPAWLCNDLQGHCVFMPSAPHTCVPLPLQGAEPCARGSCHAAALPADSCC